MNLKKLLIVLVIAGVGIVLVAELLTRLLFAQPLEPDRVFVFENSIPDMKEKVRYTIDPDGLRWDDPAKAERADLRILCVGGAATTTVLQDAQDTWWGQLGAKLGEKLDKSVVVAAVAAPNSSDAITGAQWAERILTEVGGFDLLIAMHGHSNLIAPASDSQFSPDSIDPLPIERPGGFKFAVAKASHLARALRNSRKNKIYAQQQRKVGERNFRRDQIEAGRQAYRSTPAVTTSPPRTQDPLEAYLHGIRMLIETAKKHDVKLLLAGEPTIFSSLISPDAQAALHSLVNVGTSNNPQPARPAPDWADRELSRFYNAARNVADDAGIPFVDLQGAVLPARENFYAEAILTDTGARAVADELLDPAAALLDK